MAKARPSLNPDDYQEGGGLFGNNGVNVTWVKCEYGKWTYPGTDTEITAALITMKTEEGKEVLQPYSVGIGFEPSNDGKTLEGDGALKKSTKLAMLMKSLVDSGFPKTKMPTDSDLSGFEGLKVRMLQIKSDRDKKQGKDGKMYVPTDLLVDSLIALPGEKKGKKSAEPEETGDEKEEKAQEVVMKVLENFPKGIQKKALLSEVYKILKEEGMKLAEANEIGKIVFKDEFLKDKPWEYNPKSGMVG